MIQVNHVDDATIVALGGDFDSMSESALEEVREILLREADSAEPANLVVDFSQTRFFGSSFIEILFMAFKRLRARKGTLTVCALTPFCQDIFRAARIDLLWDVHPTLEEALANINEG